MRRTPLILSSLALGASLAFAPVASTDEEAIAEDGPSIDLTVATTEAAVTGTLDFAGAATVGSDAAGDAQAPGVGLDVGDLRIEQDGSDMHVTLDLLDTAAGEVAPTALYKVDVVNNLSLLAYRGPGVWEYQLADFSDGYSSGEAAGSFDGDSITWTVPATSFGSAGNVLFPTYMSSQGVSPAGLLSLQLSGFVEVDAGTTVALHTLGGRIDVDITDAAGEIVESGFAFRTPSGDWSYAPGELAPGTYTVTATSAYGTVDAFATTELVVEAAESTPAE